MADPLSKTFSFLARSGNPIAGRLLLRAMQVKFAPVQREAIEAILRRGEPVSQRELIRAYPSFEPEQRAMLDEAHSSLSNVVRDALRGSDRALRQAALDFVRSAHAYSHVECLLRLMLEGGAAAATAFDVLTQLVDRLEAQSFEIRSADRSATRNQEQTAEKIHSWLPRFRTSARLNELIDNVLILASAERRVIRNLLIEAEPDLVQTAWQRLETGTHRGLIRQLFALLDRESFSEKVAEILQRRDDPEFVVQMLRALSPQVLRSRGLRRITHLAWLDVDAPDLGWIPDDGHATVVHLVDASGMATDEKLRLYRWMITNGSLPGRLAATALLAESDPDTIETAVYDGLNSEDASIQAWATSHLRDRPTPSAFTELIRQLDNADDQVRRVARDEFTGFGAELLLELFDELSPHICRRLGALAEKIDRGAVDELIGFLQHPIRRQQITAMRAVCALGFQRRAESELLKLLGNDDYVVRRSAIDALQACDSPQVERGLALLLGDDDSRIRNAVHRNLLERRGESTRAAVRSSEQTSSPTA